MCRAGCSALAHGDEVCFQSSVTGSASVQHFCAQVLRWVQTQKRDCRIGANRRCILIDAAKLTSRWLTPQHLRPPVCPSPVYGCYDQSSFCPSGIKQDGESHPGFDLHFPDYSRGGAYFLRYAGEGADAAQGRRTGQERCSWDLAGCRMKKESLTQNSSHTANQRQSWT